jgi:ribosome recycling factor
MNGQREMRVFHYPNMIVRVHFPDLTEDERKKRTKELYKATENILKFAMEGRRKK